MPPILLEASLQPLRSLPRTICHKPFSTVQALVASRGEDTERLPIHADRPSKFPCLGDAGSDGIQIASVFDKIKHRRRRGGRTALALYTPPSQLNGVSEFAESRDISLQFTYISRAQIRDISVWHSIGYQTMRQLKLLNTTDISAVARAMAFMGYRDTFLLNGLADAMWCLAKVRRGKLFDSAEILHSFRKLNFIPRMLALDAITADLRRQGWDRYKWRSADIAKIFLYYSSLPPRVAEKLRDQAFLQDLEAHIETKLGRMSARDISLISRSTSISLDRLTEAFLRSKEIRTGNLLYFCITLLKADITRPPVNFMNRLRREIDSTFTQLKPAHIERFLHVFMNFECFSDDRILICLARATESNLERMSQRRLRSILLAFHRLCKPTNSLLPQLAARVRAAVPREAIHAETIALLMRAFAVESPLKQQQNTRLILNDLGRQLVERLRLTGRTAATRHPITLEVNNVEECAGPIFENRVSKSPEVVESVEDNTPYAAVGDRSGRNEPSPSRAVQSSSTVLRSEPSPRAADAQRIPSVRCEPVDPALGAEDGLDEDQLAVLKQMEQEVQLLRDLREQEIAGEKVSVGDAPETVDFGPRGEYDDFINSDRVPRLMHVVAGKHPAHHRLIRKLERMEKKLADLYSENDSEEPAVKSREYREVVRRWKRRKSRELTGEEKHRLAAGFEKFTIRWRKWRRKILAKYSHVDFDSVARNGPGKLERRVARPKKLAYNQKSYLALRKSAALAEALKDTPGLSCRSQVYESLAHNAVEHVCAITDAETALEEFSQLVLAIVSSQEPLGEAYGALIAGFQEALNRETVHGSYLRLATAYVDLVLSARTINGSIAGSLLDRCLEDPTVRPNDLLLHACPITTLAYLHGQRREELQHRLASALATPSTEALSSASTLQDSVACLLLLGEDIWPVCDRLSLKTENVERAAAAIRTRTPDTYRVEHLIDGRSVLVGEVPSHPQVAPALHSVADLEEDGWTFLQMNCGGRVCEDVWIKKSTVKSDESPGTDFTIMYASNIMPDTWSFYLRHDDGTPLRIVATNERHGGTVHQEIFFTKFENRSGQPTLTEARQNLFDVYLIKRGPEPSTSAEDRKLLGHTENFKELLLSGTVPVASRIPSIASDWIPESQFGDNDAIPYDVVEPGSAADVYFSAASSKRSLRQILDVEYPEGCLEDSESDKYCLSVVGNTDFFELAFELEATIRIPDIGDKMLSLELKFGALLDIDDFILDFTLGGAGCAVVWQVGARFGLTVTVCFETDISGDDLFDSDDWVFAGKILLSVSFSMRVSKTELLEVKIEGSVDCKASASTNFQAVGMLGVSISPPIGAAGMALDLTAETPHLLSSDWEFASGIEFSLSITIFSWKPSISRRFPLWQAGRKAVEV
ncbi:hypothetical protein FOL46_007190 [Perkinsus olseni]|uniref:Uncharacterized protein n=1 Tax=Perkinsus olseni TaxID=32597 RepID=A0A7J6MXS8_PEROL|nr:hypothetical protein FOL46_007190 [Perkinsus olseni]